MREWSLRPGDPLVLTLASDFRLCSPDYSNDHIWVLEIDTGDPLALSLRTTFGLRARAMRLFPRFTIGDQAITNPAAFTIPPCLRYFYPNFLSLEFSPIPGIDVLAEYWAPDSHAVAGRYIVSNNNRETVKLIFEQCGQLAPLNGQSLVSLPAQSTTILAGQCANLAPVIFLTGGSQPGPGPYPSLSLNLSMAAGEQRTFTWVHAALGSQKESFELACQIAARPWEAERARIELVNSAHCVDILSGNPDWDAAFALSQKIALGLFFGQSSSLPFPSFVLTRQPDQGFSPRGDGSDYPHAWSGQQPLETHFLASLLPGAPDVLTGLVRNFISSQTREGVIDWKPGIAGQRGKWLAAPLLADLSWKIFQQTQDLDFLRQVQAGLEAFMHRWTSQPHDRDGDGFPEWDHPMQAGLDDIPTFYVWQKDGLGAEISFVESPALGALLCREAKALAKIAEALGKPNDRKKWKLESERLSSMVEDCWDASARLYHLRDRDTHLCPVGKILGTLTGPGTEEVGNSLPHPMRLLVRVEMNGGTNPPIIITLRGKKGELVQSEGLSRHDFQWGSDMAVATSRNVFSRVDEFEVNGINNNDRVSVSVMDFSSEDITLFLPLWAGIPNSQQALEMVSKTLLANERFGKPFGFPTCTRSLCVEAISACTSVNIPWNSFVGEGLLEYGFREEAALLTSRLMDAVVGNLKRQHSFFRFHDAETGSGRGERNHIHGLAPLGLFLSTLGLRIDSPERVGLSGKNPFPWPVTVKYRGLTVTRNANQTVIVFPGSRIVTLEDPTDAVVSAE